MTTRPYTRFSPTRSVLGTGSGPNPVRLLAVAVANCLAASLLFALRKFKNETSGLRAVGTVNMARNPQNRLRVGRIGVDLQLTKGSAEIIMLERVLGQFEEFCVVTQSGASLITIIRLSVSAQAISAGLLRQSQEA